MAGKGGKEKKAKPAEEETKPEEKAKPERQAFINQYGFLHVSEKIAEHLGVPKFGKDTGQKVPVTIELIEGGFIVRKV